MSVRTQQIGYEWQAQAIFDDDGQQHTFTVREATREKALQKLCVTLVDYIEEPQR